MGGIKGVVAESISYRACYRDDYRKATTGDNDVMPATISPNPTFATPMLLRIAQLSSKYTEIHIFVMIQIECRSAEQSLITWFRNLGSIPYLSIQRPFVGIPLPNWFEEGPKQSDQYKKFTRNWINCQVKRGKVSFKYWQLTMAISP